MTSGSECSSGNDAEPLHLPHTIITVEHATLWMFLFSNVHSLVLHWCRQSLSGKYITYMLAARFFDMFECLPKFILRLWTGMLKGPDVESKLLFQQALDILAPILSHLQVVEAGFSFLTLRVICTGRESLHPSQVSI